MELAGFIPDPAELGPRTSLAIVIGLGVVALFISACAGLFSEAKTRRIMNRRLSF